MEFLVEFEVKIPDGTPESEIKDRQEAEAVAAAQLAEKGHLVRVWTTHVASGASTVLGLYRADDEAQLDGLLGGLPLYRWMHVAVTPLEAHPNDPAVDQEADRAMEYLVTMTTHVPEGTSDDAVADVRVREAARARELAADGHLLRLWRPPLAPGEWRTLGLFAADGEGELEKVLASMPLHVWRTDEITPLSPHPNDPATGGTGTA